MSEHTEIWRSGLEQLIEYKRSQRRMTGWFVYQENKMNVREEMRASGKDPDAAENHSELLCECVRRLPLSIPRGSVIAGTQDDAFSPSYALINPAFQVETFAGYCDPVAVYDDIAPDDEFPAERIAKVRGYFSKTPYVRALNEVYRKGGDAIREVVYFVEPVTGHVIPDFRGIMKNGVSALPAATGYGATIRASSQAAVILARRYAEPILKADPDEPQANFGMGMSYFVDGQYAQAEKYLKVALESRPNEPALLNNLAICCYRLSRYEEALVYAGKALARLPDAPAVRKTYEQIRKTIDEKNNPVPEAK